MRSTSEPSAGSAAIQPRQRLEALSRIGRSLGQPSEPQELYRAAYRGVVDLMDVQGFIISLFNPVSQVVTVVYQVEAGKELPGGSFPLGQGFTSQVIRSGQPILIKRWTEQGPKIQIQYATDHKGLPESGVTVPLSIGDRVLGAMSVQSYKPETYGESDLWTLELVATQFAAALDRLERTPRLDSEAKEWAMEMETVLARMGDGLLVVDGRGAITRLNRAAREMLGPPNGPGVVVGQPLDREQWGLWPLGARALAEAITPLVQALRRGEGTAELEVEIRTPDVRIFSFTSAPLIDGQGETGGLVVFRDVTGRREAEKLKEEIITIASHDLRTPLTVLKGHLQILESQIRSGTAPPDQVATGLGVALNQVDRLTRLLEMLLDLSRVEAGRLEIVPKQMDLRALADGVIQGMQITTSRHRLVLSGLTRLDGWWDERRLEQVLRNLLSNAIKYSTKGGQIDVDLSIEDEEAVLRVRDEGAGIPAEDLPHIFEKSYRVAGTRSLEGSGLGLYICEGIVAAHGGRIWAESPGIEKGSCFTIALPIRPNSSSGQKPNFSGLEVSR